MYANGVSHIASADDFDGVRSVVNWLSYVPKRVGAPLSPSLWNIDTRNNVSRPDPVDRPVEFVPSTSAYDPRLMITGHALPNGTWQSGLFDRGSFTEMLGGWARTVVCGRARLGGISVGVIAVETRPVDVVVPADPANPESVATIKHQAGQVWYPGESRGTFFCY
jgi:acetyl-CoA carboxylase carboxyltransferase component